MSEELKYKLNSPGDCLSEKTMFDYIDHKLSPKERHIVEKHMLDCELCADAMEGLELVKDRRKIMGLRNSIDSRLVDGKEAKVITFNFRTVMSIAAGLALLIIGVFFFNKTSESLKESDMAQVMNSEEAPPPPPTDGAAQMDSTSVSVAREEEPTYKADNKSGLLQTVTSGDAESAADEKMTPGFSDITVAKDPAAAGEVAREGTKSESYEKAADDRNSVANNTAAPVQEEISEKPQLNAVLESENSKKEAKKKAEEQKVAQGPESATYGGAAKNTPDQMQSKRDKSTNNENAVSTKQRAKDSGADRKNRTDSTKEKEKSGKSNAPNKAGGAGNISSGNTSPVPQTTTPVEDEELDLAKSQVSVADSLTNGFVLDFAEEMPAYPGGNAAMVGFLNKNLDLKGKTFESKDGLISTKVIAQFVIDKTGEVQDAKIIKSVSPEVDKEVLRVIRMMPKWNPGKNAGKLVPVRLNVPIQLEPK